MTLPRRGSDHGSRGDTVQAAVSIEIPFTSHGGEAEVIEIVYDELSDDIDDVLQVLREEKAKLHYWITIAQECYRRRYFKAFERLLDIARTEANVNYDKSEEDRMLVFDSMAAYYVQLATKEKNTTKKIDLYKLAAQNYHEAEKINMYNPRHILGRAYYFLYEGEKMDQANAQFDFVLNQEPSNIPSLLGKACIAYNKKDYKLALTYYKKALRTNPGCPANVRYGLGLCFLKLGNESRARMAFERALELDENCVGALVGLAIMDLNAQTRESIQEGVKKLSIAYSIDPSNPMVLNHLANHFFYKKEYAKVQHLANHAYHNTENQGDTENAAQCFERVLKAQPNNYETMRILGALYANSDNEEKREIAKSHLKKVTDHFKDDVEAWVELAQILAQNDLAASLSANTTALKIFTEIPGAEHPPEILNNMGSLHYLLGNVAESREFFEKAYERSKEEAVDDEQYSKEISYTIRYNLARVFEGLCQYDKAERLYKGTLLHNSNT